MSSVPWDATRFVPKHATLKQLRDSVQGCRGCDLYLHATQAVIGEGRPAARVMMVGEEPGDKEDLAGRPFVGPAGRLLDRALEEAGIARADVYLTNAVKHFKFEERGKRRIHKKPSDTEVAACRPWLVAEVECVRPEIIVCLGATAVLAILGKEHRVLRDRGRFFSHSMAKYVTPTVHPSAVLRSPDAESRRQQYVAFVKDLKGVRRMLDAPSRTANG